MPDTALVTGGSGVVGTAVVRHLIADGRDVRALARSTTSAHALEAIGATVVRGDILDPASLAVAVEGCPVVYHLAGRVEFCSKDPTAMFDVNVRGTQNVIEAARRGGVQRIVHTSSTVTLGEARGSVGSETTAHRGSFLTRYEESKYEAEVIALAASRRGDLEVVVVNPSSVQGPGRSTGTGRILLDAVNDRLPVMFDVPFSIVDMDDCARGHLLAERLGVPGERYVLSGFTLLASEAIALLSDLTGRPSSVRLLPPWMLGPLAPLAQLAGRFIDSVPVCAESFRQLRSGARYDAGRATRELGLEYLSARQTFARILEWFRSEGLTEL